MGCVEKCKCTACSTKTDSYASMTNLRAALMSRDPILGMSVYMTILCLIGQCFEAVWGLEDGYFNSARDASIFIKPMDFASEN